MFPSVSRNGTLVVGDKIGFFLGEHRRTAGQHLLVIGHRLVAALAGEKVQRGASAGVLLLFQAEQLEVGAVVEDIAAEGILDENAAGQVIDDRLEKISFRHELLLGFLRRGDVAGQAEGSDDHARGIPPGHLGRRAPGLGAVLLRDEFHPADHWLAGADDLLFARKGRLGVFQAEKIEVSFSDHLVRRTETMPRRIGLVHADKAAVEILEINPVGDGLNQHVENQRIERLVDGARVRGEGGDVGHR
jgi:hypothetical protein